MSGAEEGVGVARGRRADIRGGADGANTNAEMPKRINCGHMVGESWARMRSFELEDELVTALSMRLKREVRAMLRKMKAKAAAAAAATANSHVHRLT